MDTSGSPAPGSHRNLTLYRAEFGKTVERKTRQLSAEFWSWEQMDLWPPVALHIPEAAGRVTHQQPVTPVRSEQRFRNGRI